MKHANAVSIAIGLAAVLAAAPVEAQTVKPYQMSRTTTGANCATDACTVAFPAVEAGSTLTVKNVSCVFFKDNSSFADAMLKKLDAMDVLKNRYVLAPTNPDSVGRFWVVQAVDFPIGPGQHAAVTIGVNGGMNTVTMTCTIAGTVSKP